MLAKSSWDSVAFARVTLPEYAFVDPVGGLAVGLLQNGGGVMPGAAVQTLAPVPEVLPPFLRALVALALPSDVSQPSAKMPYHLLYAVMMMGLLVFIGRAG